MYKYENFIGKVLDGRYKILELVGLGGMAFVLKAEDLVMNRIVAIKILNDEYNGNEQAEARFINESKAVAMLSHKNIVNIYDVAIYPDIKYIVMEFLDGITLREYMDNKGALPWKEAAVYVLQILRALAHSHSKGIVHRDIKPQNIMLEKSGEIKVTDFGIAKIPNVPSVTVTEKAIGTVYYISPEQASGKETDYYSDIYSVGILFFEAVTGSLPFTADSPLSIAMMQVSNAPPDPRKLVPLLPVGVGQIILKAMEKDPASRFTSAHSMAKAIEWLLRNPEVVFLTGVDSEQARAENPAAVSIDMIDTGELRSYDDSEIEKVLGRTNRRVKRKNPNTPPGKKKPRTAKTSRSFTPIIFGVALPLLIVTIVLGAVLGVRFLKKIWPGSEFTEAVYPNLVGKQWNENLKSDLANRTYGNIRFEVEEIIYVDHPDYESGEITAQDPVADHVGKQTGGSGAIFKFKSISVCRRADDMVVPDLRYLSYADARIALKSDEYGLQLESVKESNNDFFDGQIIRTEPEMGSPIREGDTIRLFICERSVSNTTAPMPNLVGLNRAQAIEILQYTLYRYNIIEVPSLNGDGKIYEQSIVAGATNPVDTVVDIHLSVKQNGLPIPDLVGKTYSEAITTIASLNIAVDDYHFFYVYRGDNVPFTETKGLDFSGSVAKLMEIGFQFAPENEDGIVFFQSIPTGTTVTEDMSISLLVLVYMDF